MALPPLRTDGMLPPGEHVITTLGEVFATFPALNAQRIALNAALTVFIDIASRLKLGTSIVIDGSYTTAKAEPGDIDIAMLSTGADETVTLLTLQAEGVDLGLLDVFVSTALTDFEGWVRFFSANRAGQARGIVRYTL
jgi:hypothetical protein